MPDITAIRQPTTIRRPVQILGQFLLRLIGWRAIGDLPDEDKFVLIVYPHTSNWDVPIGLIAGYALGLLTEFPYGFMVKDSAFKWPLIGSVIRWLGGIPVDRSARYNAVEQMAEVFRRRERLFLAITPEGTRRNRPYIKSGFYYIALRARAPIVPAYLDYARRLAHLGPAFWPTGNAEADLQTLRGFFAEVTPLYPHQAGDFRFKSDEDAHAERQPTPTVSS